MPGVEQQEYNRREQGAAEERIRYQGVAADVRLQVRHEPKPPDQPADIPVRLRAAGREARFVWPPLPDRVDLNQAAEQGERRADGEEQPDRAQGVAGPERRPNDVAFAAPWPRELRVVLAHDDRQVDRDQR